ncbi:AAA family ATPase [Bacillus sp. FSL W8-0848]|uniref:AAA family ATPase n=1 Tax=Bacillus sp. FSL W8-0848 TaxID=2954634 RepID=UPI0030FC278E
MYIEKIKIKNYKQFKNLEVKFNPLINILIGENGAGKTSILEAISYVLGANDRGVESEGIQSLFNVEVIKEYLDGEKNYENLPVLEVELFIAENERASV